MEVVRNLSPEREIRIIVHDRTAAVDDPLADEVNRLELSQIGLEVSDVIADFFGTEHGVNSGKVFLRRKNVSLSCSLNRLQLMLAFARPIWSKYGKCQGGTSRGSAMSVSDPSLKSLLYELGINERDENRFSRVPPFDGPEVVGNRSHATPENGKSDCFLNWIIPRGGIVHDGQEAGFNCFFQFDRPWSRFIIFADIQFNSARVQQWIKDGSGPSTLKYHVRIGSMVAAWRREAEWIGIGGNSKMLFEKEYNWGHTEGGDRITDDSWSDQSMSITQVIDSPLEARQHLMVRGSSFIRFDCNAHNYTVAPTLSLYATTMEITVIGIA